MNKYSVKFYHKPSKVDLKYVIESQNEETAKQWAEKQRNAWIQGNTDSDPRKWSCKIERVMEISALKVKA